ncbi:TorF family putative porin [Massilia sp. W12]|uniref:TorF family putative porin n=1 Tax=Massilia sp. W12 TaxID=3126507 RepID=UPI0030CDD6BA
MKAAFCSMAACGLMMAAATPAVAADEPKIQSYVLDIEAKILSERRNRGTSDTFNRPGAELNFTLAHESGWVGLLTLGSVKKEIFPDSNGWQILAATGYRWGKPDAWRFGVGLAQEWFPSAKLNGLPSGIDWSIPAPTGLANTKFDTTYGVFEFGYGALEGRYLYVLSKDLRGNNTATICGSLYLPAVLAGGDPSQAMDCYGSGMKHSGGTHLLDLDYKHRLDGQSKLLLHLGYQKLRNFSGGDIWDWKIGVTHQRFGLEFGAEVVGARLRNAAYGVAFDANRQSHRIDKTALVLSLAKKF